MLGIEGETKLMFYFYFKRPVEIEKKKFCVVSSKQGYSNSMFVQQQYLKWRNGIHVFFCITCFYCFFYTKKTNIKIFNKNLGVEAQQIWAEMCKKTTFRHFYKIYLSKSGIRESYIWYLLCLWRVMMTKTTLQCEPLNFICP